MIARRSLMLGAMATVVACSGAVSGSGTTEAGDMPLGSEDAPLTLIEYASVTCHACLDFHQEVWPQLKENYIDTGKVRFIFRELPAPPQAAPIAVAGFQVARCGGASAEEYFSRIDVLFDQQEAIFAAGSMEGVRQKLVEIGAGAGLSEQQVMECITDPAGAERIRQTVEGGTREFDVTSTPTLILNDEKLADPSAFTYAGLSRILDAAIAERS